MKQGKEKQDVYPPQGSIIHQFTALTPLHKAFFHRRGSHRLKNLVWNGSFSCLNTKEHQLLQYKEQTQAVTSLMELSASCDCNYPTSATLISLNSPCPQLRARSSIPLGFPCCRHYFSPPGTFLTSTSVISAGSKAERGRAPRRTDTQEPSVWGHTVCRGQGAQSSLSLDWHSTSTLHFTHGDEMASDTARA